MRVGGYDEEETLSSLHLKECIENDKWTYKEEGENNYDTRLRNSISRARSKVFEYAMCNDFDYFVTLTLDKNKLDRYDLKEFIKKLGQFIRDMRKKYKSDIQYLLIPEMHKDGAWHMHGLMKGIPEEHLTINEYNYLTWEDYVNRFGYISISKVQDKLACSKYITKYITKDFGQGIDKGSKLYYASRGLKTAKKIKEGILSEIEILSINWQYENEYIKSIDLSAEELKKILNLIK